MTARDEAPWCKAKREVHGYHCSRCRASWVGKTEPPDCLRAFGEWCVEAARAALASPEVGETIDVTCLPEQMISDIKAHVRGALDAKGTYDYELGSGWRCFHCGEMFRTPGGAALHFGKPQDKAACQQSPVLTDPVLTGWRMVPVEPTLEMQQAGYDALKLFFPEANGHIGHYRIYEAMLAAAPPVPTVGLLGEEPKP